MSKSLKNKVLGAIVIEGHVQGLSNTRSLGEAGIPVYVIDKANCLARYSKYCTKYFLCPEFNSDELAYFLVTLANQENISNWLLLPSNDHAVYTISKHKSTLEQYYKVISPKLEIIDNIYDKSRLLSIADRENVPYPITQYFRTFDEPVNDKLLFPVITKGRHGLSFYKCFGKKAFLAYSENELREKFRTIASKFDIRNTFTQELIPSEGNNKTISFTAFCVYGEIKTYWMGKKLREHPWRFGTATCAESIYIPECLDQSVTLLKALNYSGVCEVEYLFDTRTQQYKLIEMNARTWLWVGLAKACGIDYAKIIWEYVNNKEVAYPKKYQVGIKWINYLTDTFIVIKALLMKQFKLSEYVASLKGPKINAVFSWKDLRPSILFPFLALILAKKRNFNL